MTTPVKPEQAPGRIPTYDEWQAAQYAPHRFGQDSTAQLPMGRIPTYDEFQQIQRSPNPSALTFSALPLPKFVADQTKRLNPNAGKPDQSILESLAAPVFGTEGLRKAAEMADVVGKSLGPLGAPLTVGATVARQVVAPIVEHPIMTAAGIAAAAASPIVVGGLFTADMLHNVAKYGYQVVQEQMMTPEDRAKAQADPSRISGEAAFVQAAMLGLAGLGVGHAIGKAADVSTGMMESGAAALRPYVQSASGAQALGAAAAEHGLPETASPYPPATPLDAAWRDGHAKPRVRIPGTVEQIPESTVPPVAPTEPVGATTEPGGSRLTPIEGTGETRTRGLATSTARVAERRGVEDDISTLWGDLPEYRRISIKDQATQALDFLGRDPEAALRVALGDEPAPSGLHPEAVFVALRNKARAEGDVGLIHDLATGGLTEQATTMGQRLRLLAENDPEDPVAKIRRISDKRSEGRGAAKATKSEIAEIEKHTALNMKGLMDFFESQKC